jgi:hypothetical protein
VKAGERIRARLGKGSLDARVERSNQDSDEQ